MTNSTIKNRIGFCIDCGKKRTLIAGRCVNVCYKKFRASESKKRLASRDKKPAKTMLTEPTTIDIEDDELSLTEWYDDKIKIVSRKPICWNCGKSVSSAFYFHAIAHIFPKSIYPSVAKHDDNFLILPAGCCHGLSHRIDLFSKMRVFPMAVERYKRFRDQIKERHKYEDLFVEAAKKLNLL